MTRLLFALGLFATALAPPGVSAQESPREKADRLRLEYNSAKAQYDADNAEVQRIRYQWNQLMIQHSAALDRDDDDDVLRLRGQLQERSGPKHRAENARRASREEWLAAGDSLMDALNDYLDTLDDQIRSSQVGSDDTASKLYDQYEEELREVERELASESQELPELVMPEVEVRPEDGPRDIRRKLNLLEDKVKDTEDLLATLDRQIERLIKRQVRENRRKPGGDIFDDNVDPTGVGTDVTGGTQVTDTAVLTLEVKPLEVRIAEKKEFREEVNDHLNQLMARAEEIRRRVSGT